MIDITFEDVVRVTRELIAEKGEDFVYASPHPQVDGLACFYAHEMSDGSIVPGCIVGHILPKLGVPLSNDWDQIGSTSSLIRELEGDGVIGTTESKARVFLGFIQENQDNRETWGKSFELALEVTENYDN